MKNIIFLLSSTFIYLLSSVSYAKNKDDLLLNITHCSTISNNDLRLACFDQLIPDSAKKSVTVATATVLPAVDNTLEKQKQIDDFAKEHLKKIEEEQKPSSLFSTVSKLKKLLRGQWVIYLENGQTWQQTDTTPSRLKVGNKVRLDKGAMGAVYLYKENSHLNIKVKRLK